MGYLGGGLLLAANLLLVSFSQRLGISRTLAVRISPLSAGAWWGAFAAITFLRLRTRAPARSRPADLSYVAIGVSELRGLWAALRELPHTRRFLVAWRSTMPFRR